MTQQALHPQQADSECCQLCKFSQPTPELTVRLCRRYPPAAQLVQTPRGPSPVALSPPVPLDGWCGEFARPSPTFSDSY